MDNQPKHGDSFNALALAIFSVNTALVTAGDALTKPVGQSSARWRILGRVSAVPQTVSQIARVIGYARQSVQRVADDLVNEKLAEYIPNPRDQRAHLLKLTPKGRQALTTIEAEQQRWVERLLSVLDEQELARLAGQLRSISECIQDDYQRTYGKQAKKGEKYGNR